jgi:hypothetical protein
VAPRNQHVELPLPEANGNRDSLDGEAPTRRKREVVVDPAVGSLPDRFEQRLAKDGPDCGSVEDLSIVVGELRGDLVNDRVRIRSRCFDVGIEFRLDCLPAPPGGAELLQVDVRHPGEEVEFGIV